MGLCSDIGVHSLLDHLYGLLELAKRNGLDQVYLHAFMDGRDSPPDSGAGYLQDIEAKMQEIGIGKIASICGRFYAMDRDSRWERVQEAFDCLRFGKGAKAECAADAMMTSYAASVTDEFIKPTVVLDVAGQPIATINDDDTVIFFNFRADRARQMTRALNNDNLREARKLVGLFQSQYGTSHPFPLVYDSEFWAGVHRRSHNAHK